MGPHFNKAHNLGLTLHGTLPTINKPKHPKEGENKEKRGTHIQEDK
jgi:hypothetical protein